jgi:hypothetical protein
VPPKEGASYHTNRAEQRSKSKTEESRESYALIQQNANTSNAVITGIIQVSSTYAYVLFDPGATHSFVFIVFAKKHNLESVIVAGISCDRYI